MSKSDAIGFRSNSFYLIDSTCPYILQPVLIMYINTQGRSFLRSRLDYCFATETVVLLLEYASLIRGQLSNRYVESKLIAKFQFR